MNIRSKEKYLTIKQVAHLLKLPEVTIQRWEHQGKIPCKIINEQVMFQKSTILNWASQHDLAIYEPRQQGQSTSGLLLSRAIRKGQIFYDIEGTDVYSVFNNALKKLSFISADNLQAVLEALIDREELNSTGIGKGIAIPHTRNRLDLGIREPHIAVFFLKSPIPFSAIDEQDVYVLFMIFTATVKEHLKMLSKISFILQQDAVQQILLQKNKDNNLILTIEQLENEKF